MLEVRTHTSTKVRAGGVVMISFTFSLEPDLKTQSYIQLYFPFCEFAEMNDVSYLFT